MLLTYGLTGGGEEQTATLAVPEAATLSLQQRAQAVIEAEARRQAAEQERAADIAEQRLAELQAGLDAPGPFLQLAQEGLLDPDGGPAGPRTEAEAILLETLRLEAIERRTRSLRTEPLVLTYRDTAAGPGAVSTTPPRALDPPPPVAAAGPAGTLEQSIASAGDFIQLLADLEAEEAAGSSGAATAAPVLPVTPLLDAVPAEAPIVERPEDPEGWDRIYEGSFLEAVLMTQLDEDFPGPGLATVAIPFYSADRQRVVIPRGARLVGAPWPAAADRTKNGSRSVSIGSSGPMAGRSGSHSTD